MILLRNETRLGLTVEHQTENVSSPLMGVSGYPKTFLCSSKGRHIRVRPSKGFSLRRAPVRVTKAGAGQSSFGIGLRHDKAGEGSGRDRKATGCRGSEGNAIEGAPTRLGWLGAPTKGNESMKLTKGWQGNE